MYSSKMLMALARALCHFIAGFLSMTPQFIVSFDTSLYCMVVGEPGADQSDKLLCLAPTSLRRVCRALQLIVAHLPESRRRAALRP